MSVVSSFLVGYLIGCVPSANGLARLAGVDLRAAGSGNPGASNARRVAGFGLATAVLVTEVSKGVVAVLIGEMLAGETGMVLAGIGAATGNVFNLWYRFSGGKGLGITLGVLVAAWPIVAGPALLLIGAVAIATRSSGVAALVTISGVLIAAFLASQGEWPTWWGLSDRNLLPWLAVGLVVVLAPKHLRDALSRRPFLL